MQNFKDWTVAKGRPLLDNGEGKFEQHHKNVLVQNNTVQHNWEWLPTHGLTPLAPTQSLAGSLPNHASLIRTSGGITPEPRITTIITMAILFTWRTWPIL